MAVLFPLPFGPTINVRRCKGSVVFRRTLKFSKVMDSIIEDPANRRPAECGVQLESTVILTPGAAS